MKHVGIIGFQASVTAFLKLSPRSNYVLERDLGWFGVFTSVFTLVERGINLLL